MNAIKQDSPMKVAICHPLDINSHGGVETHIRCLARALAALGVHIDLYCQLNQSTTERFDDLPCLELRKFDPSQYKIIHTHSGFFIPELTGYLLNRNRSQRHIHTTHNIAFDYLIGCNTPFNWRCYTSTLLEWFWSAWADQVITVSESARQWAISRFGIRPDHVTTIPNGSGPITASMPIRFELRRKLHLNDTDIAGIFVGRGYDRVKGTPDIAHAFNQLTGDYPQLKLIAMPGTGFENAPWLIKTGVIQHDQVEIYYQAADFFINASYSEGLPLTLVEAMSASLPIIATRVGGIPDIIRHNQNGLLIARDRSNIADLIRKIIIDPVLKLKLAQNAFQSAENLTWDKIARKTLKIYRQAFSGR